MSETPTPPGDFRALVEAAREPVAVWHEGSVVFANAALAECLGYAAAAELHGLSADAFVAAHDASGERPAWLDDGAPAGEARLRRRDGAERILTWRTAHLRFDDAPARALYLRDVTDEVAAREAWRRSEENFRAMIERSPLAVCVTQADHIVYVNNAMLEYLGYESEGGMKAPTLAALSDAIVEPADRDRMRETFHSLFIALAQPGPLASRAVRIDDVRLRSARDGSPRTCDIHGIVVTHDGKPALVTYLHDQTERRATADRIRLADRMSSLGTLAAGVAHEINNPLTYVIGNVELVAQQLAAGGGDASGHLDAARTGLERIRKTVRALKTFSRGDEEAIGPVEVVPVLESCIDIAENQLRHRGRIVREYARVPPVTGNEARLAQVFLNLLVNAAQALDEARASENVVIARVAAQRRGVLIEISDNGCGIAPEALPRVFDPFFTTKPVGIGTGLGLFVCHGIVESLGGEIVVDSAPGRGTSVRVLLPRATPTAEIVAAPPVAAAPARARVLVVDDEPMVRRLVQVILGGESEVDLAASAAEALERLLGPVSYDLVLCDLMMPEMSGAELCRRLEAERPEAARRIVYMTGGAVTESLDSHLEETARPRLDKPFTPSELRTFVRRHLAIGTAP
jgi:PAS domain S-box-containing protein